MGKWNSRAGAYIEGGRELCVWAEGDVCEDFCHQVEGHAKIVAECSPPFIAQEPDSKPSVPAIIIGAAGQPSARGTILSCHDLQGKLLQRSSSRKNQRCLHTTLR